MSLTNEPDPLRHPTHEESQTADPTEPDSREVREFVDRMSKARKAITDKHGTKKPYMDIVGNLPCPVCETGESHYRISSYNGHIHATCTTEGCVRWME